MTVIPREGIKAMWPTVAPLLAPAVAQSRGRIDMASVFDWLQRGLYLLWVTYPDDKVVRAAFVTREAQYPRRRMLTVDAAGGIDLDQWVETVDQTFRAYAHQAGLDGVELYGRMGWVRALRKLGWQQSAVLCETVV